MSLEPQPVAEVSKAIGISTRQINRLIEEGHLPPRPAPGLYDLAATCRAYIDYIRSGPADGAAQRARLDKARADEVELRLARERREMLPLDEVLKDISDVAAEVRSRLLALPTRIAPLVIGCTRIPQVKAILDDAIHDALTSLESAGDVLGSADTAAEADSQPVGRRKQKAKPRSKRRARAVED